ncbi:MAG TPA: hypothetical protein VMU86_09680 [Steroidobacteraceae bacterium]|nr:hypothetical protein [Steroidobacteraceae bacterium]
MVPITPDEAAEYRERWRLLDEIEIINLRRTSPQTKALQLSALMASRHLFRDDPQRDDELRLVRERWALIARALGG